MTLEERWATASSYAKASRIPYRQIRGACQRMMYTRQEWPSDGPVMGHALIDGHWVRVMVMQNGRTLRYYVAASEF